jgi:hypothetical protein
MPGRARSLMISLSVVGALVLTAQPAAAASSTASTMGRQLVNRFFTDTVQHNFTDLRKFLSPAFQVQRADGTRQTKAQYLAKFPVVISFKLRNFRVTAAGRSIVVSYQANAFEIIHNKLFRSGFEPRLSVFVKSAAGWQLVAHSNFNRPK